MILSGLEGLPTGGGIGVPIIDVLNGFGARSARYAGLFLLECFDWQEHGKFLRKVGTWHLHPFDHKGSLSFAGSSKSSL